MKHLIQDEKVISVTGTLILHGLILLLLLWITVDFNPQMSEFVEVTFSSGFAGVKDTPPSPATPAAMAQSVPAPSGNPRPPVTLPQRRQSDLPEETIHQNVSPETEKPIQPGAQERLITPETIQPVPEPAAPVASLPLQKQEKPVPRGLFQKSESIHPTPGTTEVTRDVARNFEIDWQGEIQREIYQMRLPEFPPDVQQEAIIKIKFTVLPDGTIGSAILLQKGQTRLENLTLEAFKTWRFNALPASVAQVPQTGIITFRFKLK